ncbi:MAG TPA: LysM peptidoglycan-binding domain-containing protein [Paludibacter sp.]
MKKKIIFFIIAGFSLITLSLVGQNNNYPTKKINGIEYYIYTVQTSEGLYAIGRKFEVSPADISKANPEIQSGLKVGQQVLIPIQKKSTEKIKEKTAKDTNSVQEFKQHKVKKNQTLFAISNKYNISQEEIIKYNPEIEKGLREGIVLQIPKEVKEKKKKEKEKENTVSIQSSTQPKNGSVDVNKTFFLHQVQPKETLYSLGRLYKVKVIDIIRLNPGSAVKLVVGSDLKISANESNLKLRGQNEGSSNYIADINNQFANNNTPKTELNNKVIQIAFLLPFMLDQDKQDPTIERFVDFYAGALLAIEEAKQKGISLEIYTYDTEKSEEKITAILSNPELKNMDLIIGPAFSNQVSLVADFAKENKINTLIPFTSKVPEIEYNPYLFQFNPGTDSDLKFTFDLLNGKYKNAHIMFAEIPGVSSFDEGRIRVETLQKELNKERKSFSKIELTTSDYADFKTGLKKGEKNIVIFNTDKFAYISPFIGPLQTQADEYDIILLKQYSWKNQDTKMPLSIYISPFRINENSTKLTNYNEQFTQLFSKDVSIDSPRFDLLGYDLSGYFISLLHRYGNKFIDKIGSYNYSNDIQSQPQFERTSNGSGFINQRLYLGEDKAE